MHSIKKLQVINNKKNKFILDPQLNNLKNQNTVFARKANWNMLIPELKKFGIIVSSLQKNAIINDANQSLIVEILEKLKIHNMQQQAAVAGTRSMMSPIQFGEVADEVGTGIQQEEQTTED